MENRSNSSANHPLTHSVRLPILGRIVWMAAALAACAIVWPVAWDEYRASRSVVAAQDEVAWGRLEAATLHLDRATGWTPGDADIYATLADVHMSIARLRGDEDAEARAIAALRSAVRLHPFDAELHAALGSTHLAFGSLEAASDAFDRALELDPHNMLYLASMAQVREAQGRFEQAAALYRRAMSIQPSGELETQLERIERR